MKKKYYYPKVSISLGPPEVHAERLARIDDLARQLGVTRSELFQMIGDGKLIVSRPVS